VLEDKSRLRQGIRLTEEERGRQLEFVLSERGPLIRGTVVVRKRLCGHPGCRCATEGRLHVSPYLSVTLEGKTRTVHLPAADQQHVREASDRYRRFRKARTRLVELTAQQLRLVDRLGNLLLEAYPAGEKIVPAGRRGRSRKRGRDASR
jgi:hypothetical protein